MPRFSAFTPFGMFAFSSRPSHAETIYRSMAASHGEGTIADNPDAALRARWYASAMAVARARYTLERAGNQADPRRVAEMLPLVERAYGIVPGPEDTIDQRRAVVAVHHLLAQGNVAQNVENALRAALGDDLVQWRPTPPAEAVSYPDPADGQASFKLTARYKIARILTSVTVIGQQWVRYETRSGDTNPFEVNEVLVVDPGRVGQQERVVVLDTIGEYFLAEFQRSHESGSLVTSQSFPYWLSTLRHALVVVKNGRAIDPEVRRKTHAVLSHFLPGTATWDIVEENATPGSTGPFKVDQSGIGIVPIPSITL